MKVIGVCGQSGSGKGLVCSFFSELNVVCIDTDKVYHSIISENSECTEEIVAHFGETVFQNPGINRSELRRVAFESPDNLKKLNEITHKHILGAVRSQISRIKRENKADGIIVDAPLLFESGFDKECDATLAVLADRDAKIARIMSRDSITEEQAIARISSQITNDKLADICDYVIYNSSDAEALRDSVKQMKN